MSEAVVSAPAPGEVLAGKYCVERVIGAGGMGVVVVAMHQHLGQRVALKFLHPHVVHAGLERFMREARAVAKLKNEHVARVMDVGTLDTGAPFIVMEYLEGEDLGARVDRGPLALHEAVDYLLQACVAIAEAHALGIVHRDLKPSNLFLTQRADGAPLVKVLDFGISKSTASEGQPVTATSTGAVMGSPAYMSPEQVKGAKSLDARADIWSLGVVLYQLVTGRLPFEAENIAEMFASILHFTPPAPSVARPDLPPAIDAIFFRAVAKDPAHRFQSLAELARALGPFGSPSAQADAQSVERLLGQTAAVPLVQAVAPGVPVATAATDQALVVSTAQARTRGGSAALIVGGAAVALIGVVAIGGVLGIRAIASGRASGATSAPPPMSAEVSPARSVAALDEPGPSPSAEPAVPPAASAGDAGGTGKASKPRASAPKPKEDSFGSMQ